MSTPFRDAAPALWAAGYAAMPLRAREKRPFLPGWTEFTGRLPDAEEREYWLRDYGDGNVGVAMGKASGVVAMDVDTDDDLITGVLRKVLPRSPWERVGKKGLIWLFKWTPDARTFRMDLEGGERIFELLGAGTQIVVPPSIHPDTGREYTANVPLSEVDRSELCALPTNIEMMIREAMAKAGVKLRGRGPKAGGGGGAGVVDFISKGGRDVEMTRKAGLLARAVARGERTLKEAMGEMAQWVKDYTEQVWGDPLDVAKATRKVAEFVLRDATGVRKVVLASNWDDGLTPDDKDKLGLGLLGADARKWAPNEIMEYIVTEMSRPGVSEDQQAKADVAELTTQRIAVNSDLTAINEGMLVRYLAGQTGVTAAEIRARIRTLREGELSGLSHQEIAMAAVKELSSEGEVRWDQGCFWRWKGSHWEQFEDHKITGYLGENYSKYPVMHRYSDHVGALRAMRDSAEVNKPLRQIGLDGVNFVNGYLTTDGRLVDHDPDYGMTYCLPYPYRPEMVDEAPKWFSFLDKCWGHDADYDLKKLALQEAFGVTLFGQAAALQKAFMLYGIPHSGKSQILEVIQGIMPKGCTSNVTPDSWGTSFLPADMAGKLLNVAGEISESKAIDGETFKMIIDGSAMQVQRKFGQPFTARITAAQWFAGNFLPKSRDSSEGFTRRFLIFEFNRAYPEDETRIPLLGEMIAEEEREAIAAWAVAGFLRVRSQGNVYTRAPSMKRREVQVAEANNNVRLFISGLQQAGRIRLGEKAHSGMGKKSVWTPTLALFMNYRAYCSAVMCVPPVSFANFKKRLEELQRIFDFELRQQPGPSGIQMDVCMWLTIAEPAGALQ